MGPNLAPDCVRIASLPVALKNGEHEGKAIIERRETLGTGSSMDRGVSERDEEFL